MWSKLVVILTLLSFAACQFDNFKVVDQEKYFHKMMERFVYHLEESGVSSTETLPMQDFEVNITESEYGFKVEGKMNLTEGFVMKLKRIPPPEVHQLKQHIIEHDYATIFFGFHFELIHISYAVELLEFSNLKEKYGGLEVILKEIKFVAGITQDFSTKTLKAKVDYESLTSSSDHVGIRAFPYHQIMQMAVRGFKKGHIKGIQDSLKAWNLSPFMQKAAEEVPFPELCYHCDGKMISFK